MPPSEPLLTWSRSFSISSSWASTVAMRCL